MIHTHAYACQDSHSDLKPFTFEQRNPLETDVVVEIKYCGICHTDIHNTRNEWGESHYPMVPGHEITGIVKEVGSKVKHFKVGDKVGVGCMVNSCGNCECCEKNLEQFCFKGCTLTYNSKDKDGNITKGGYADTIVVNEKFVLKIPENLSLDEAAPLLCAGITTYSPLKHWEINKNHRVGIIGLGGLGHMAVKFAKALGAHVTVFTTSPRKKDDALKMGADEVIISSNTEEMKNHINQFDFLLDTVSAPHNLEEYINLLKYDARLCMVGASPDAHKVSSGSLIWGRKSISGSLIGGIKETQEMLDFCGKHNITCDIELIPIQDTNLAFERILKSDVKYRFVIDMQSLKNN